MQADGRCIMIAGMAIFTGFYLLMVKVLKMTREFEERGYNSTHLQL
jgi:hypothetical protein